MPVEVKVRSPNLAIVQDRTFLVTDDRGEIDPETDQGLFSGDTRFLSYYRVTINELSWKLLGSAIVSHHAERLHFVNPPVPTEGGEIPSGDVSFEITRSVADGVHEDFDITNFSLHPVEFQFEIALGCDFADIFEVRERRFVRRGRVRTRWLPSRRELMTSYSNRGFRRALIYRLAKYDSVPHYANGRVVFEVRLDPGEAWHSCAHYVLIEGDRTERTKEPLYGCYTVTAGDTVMDRLQQQWREGATSLSSSVMEVTRAYQQSVEDIGALRLYDDDFAPEVWIPAAGVPSFVALFGRDSLIVSLQCMMVHAPLALGALQKLAAYQAHELDEWRDAEPGKIPHELRVGELAHLHRIPHSPYYGTADATILYLIALHEAWKWLGDSTLLQVHKVTALQCLEWIDRYGDRDGDGFQEYLTRSRQGYENMGWKDSGDAIVYPDGRPVSSPKALCELQGYVFDAKLRMAEAFETLGDGRLAAALREEAWDLQRRFEEAFWCEEIGSYALGLDSDKRQIQTVASNPGHCLWSGIASEEHGARVVERLLDTDMWSGWGVRTLSSRHPAYNPFSYQRGSVWPHDNGLIALGFKRYGHAHEANRLARDVFRAASYQESYRLPELYAGLARGEASFPVQYLGANMPQAWAAGSVFHLLQTVLGLRADAPNGRLYVDPLLPRWLPDIELRGLRVGESRVGLRFWREGETTRWEVKSVEGALEVAQEPWRPWVQNPDEAAVAGLV